MTTGNKNELLYQYGINFNDLPNWQKRGIGVYWKNIQKEGFNSKNGEKVLVNRRELFADFELPMRDEYDTFVSELIDRNVKDLIQS